MAREDGANHSRRSFLKYAGAAATTAAVAGCLDDVGFGGDDEVESITVTQGTFATTLDPVDQNDTPTHNVLDQPYEPLIYRDHDGELIELIATDWERTDDQEVTLELREDVQFHSGSEMTAEDVAFSINRTNDPDVSQQAGVIGNIEEARAGDGHEIVIELGSTEPVIFRNLSAFGRVQEEAWVNERDEGDLATEINGTGPYELDDFADDQHVRYTRFDDYWGDEPAVQEVEFDAVADDGTRVDRLVAGESDLIVNVAPDEIGPVEDDEDTRVEDVPSIRAIFMVMTNDEEPFDSKEFRQAMNHAVDNESYISSILNEFGEPTTQPSLSMQFGHADGLDPYEYDLDQANDLVAESGYEDVEIDIHTTTGRYLRDTDIADAVAGMIDDLDEVSATANHRETAQMFDEIVHEDPGDFSSAPDIFLIGWGNPTFDANYTLEPWFHPESVYNHFEHDEVPDLIDDSNQEADEGARDDILQEINEILNDEAPWIFLHQQYSIYAIRDDLEWDARSDEDVIVKEIGAN